jgi:hypothetical protein
MVLATYVALDNEGFFSEVFGYVCVDSGPSGGLAGEDPAAFMDRHTYLQDMWPLRTKFKEGMDEVTLFTMIEFLHDFISKPDTKNTRFHTWSECGYHYDKWEKKPGQQRWRDELNPQLRNYGEGFELGEKGEIQRIGNAGLSELMTDTVTAASAGDVTDGAKVVRAVAKFRSGRATKEDQREAVRELADVLENHRPKVKDVLTKDEAALFNVANNFGIRHHKPGQMTDYGPEMLTWIFHAYLASCWLVLDLKKREPPPRPEPHPHDDYDRTDDDIPF